MPFFRLVLTYFKYLVYVGMHTEHTVIFLSETGKPADFYKWEGIICKSLGQELKLFVPHCVEKVISYSGHGRLIALIYIQKPTHTAPRWCQMAITMDQRLRGPLVRT
jgi:hypothetical protein